MDDQTGEARPVPEEPAAVPTIQAPSSVPTMGQQGNGLAVAGMVLGITSVIFCWWGIFSLAQWVLAITFSAIGISHANRGAAHKGMATAGLILGIIGAVLYLVIGVVSLGAGFFI